MATHGHQAGVPLQQVSDVAARWAAVPVVGWPGRKQGVAALIALRAQHATHPSLAA